MKGYDDMVKASRKHFDEEVEIAAQYFYEMGLNEDGVNILIEELGVKEFGEFVYEIAEEYVLTEETRLQSGGTKLKGPKGSKPQSVTVKREKKQGGTKMKADAALASTVSPKRIAAAKKAKEKQPERKGILGRISQEVEKGMARHRAAMSAARDTGKTIGKAAKHIGGVAREVGKGATGATKFAGAVAREVTKEEADLFDIILEHLVAEGYADTNKAALAIMVNMSEVLLLSIIEEATRRTEYLQKKFNAENKRKSGSALTHIPGKQNTGQALYKARQSERQMRGEN